jgi:hypothetical protein
VGDRTVVTQDGNRVTLQPLSSTTFSWRKQQFRVGQGVFVWTTPLERTTNHQPLCRSVIRITGFWMDPLSGQRWVGGHTMYHHTDPRFHEVVHGGLLMQARASESASHRRRTKAKSRRATKSEDESESEELEEEDSEIDPDDYVDGSKNEDEEDEDEQVGEGEEDNEDDEYDEGDEGEEDDEGEEEEESRGSEGEESEGAIQLLFHVNELFDSTDVEYFPMAMLYEPCRINYLYVAPSPHSDEDRDPKADEQNDDDDDNDDDDNDDDDNDDDDKEEDEGDGLERRRSRMRKRSAARVQTDAERNVKKRRLQGRSNSRFQRDRRAVCTRINNELAARRRDARRRPPATPVDEPGRTFFCAERFDLKTTEIERLSEEQVQRLQLGAQGGKAKPDTMEVDDDRLPDRGEKTDGVEEAEKKNKKMSAFDLFCGCGGMSIGLQMAGIDVKWAVGTPLLPRATQLLVFTVVVVVVAVVAVQRR